MLDYRGVGLETFHCIVNMLRHFVSITYVRTYCKPRKMVTHMQIWLGRTYACSYIGKYICMYMRACIHTLGKLGVNLCT